MVIRESLSNEDCAIYSQASFGEINNFITKHNQGFIYASPKEVSAFEKRYLYIKFWLLPNDNAYNGLKKYLAILNP